MKAVKKSFRRKVFDPAEPLHEWRGEDDSSPVAGTRTQMTHISKFEDFRKRVWIAGFGGIFLLGLMWLMVLRHEKYTSLIATTVAVTLFGLIMAAKLDKEMDVLSSTAVYAAVLVVFVGMNT